MPHVGCTYDVRTSLRRIPSRPSLGPLHPVHRVMFLRSRACSGTSGLIHRHACLPSVPVIHHSEWLRSIPGPIADEMVMRLGGFPRNRSGREASTESSAASKLSESLDVPKLTLPTPTITMPASCARNSTSPAFVR
eukprot:scaffold2628_cov113-Isochrysis_galbana.AAC.10